MKKDEFETNVVDVLKEMSAIAKERLKGFRASDFSEIYLFFDYDGHNNNIPKEYLNKDILGEMLKTFNNETELGKLYVSYPKGIGERRAGRFDRNPCKACADDTMKKV